MNIISASCYAAGYDLEFVGEPTYRLTKEVSIGGEVAGWTYEINITIKNSGDTISDQTTVNLTDQEGFTLSNTTYFQPGETKTISFTWSTLSSYDQTIKVSYYPTDVEKNWNQQNYEATSFKIIVGEPDVTTENGTPGFEIVTILLAISLLYIYKKRELM